MDTGSDNSQDIAFLIESLCKTQYNPAGYISQFKNKWEQVFTLDDLFKRIAPKEKVARVLNCVLVMGYLTPQIKACLLGLVRILRRIPFHHDFLEKEVISGIDPIPESNPMCGLGYGCRDLYKIPIIEVDTRYVLTKFDMHLKFLLRGIDQIRDLYVPKSDSGSAILPPGQFVPIFCFSTREELKDLVEIHEGSVKQNSHLGSGALLLQIKLDQTSFFSSNGNNDINSKTVEDALVSLNANYFYKVTIESRSGINELKEIIYLLARIKRPVSLPIGNVVHVKSELHK